MKYMINFIRSGSIIVISSLVLLSTLLVGPYNTLFFIFSSPLHLFSSSFFASAQRLITLKDMVTYHKQSNFIKEFEIPLQERGLKGITTDAQGNAWFYHSTNHSSTIVKFDATSKKFTQYNVGGNTVVDDAVINLAGGQLLFDNGRNTLWFTDARTNSIGRLDLMKDSASSGGGNGSGGDIGKNGKVMLISIPTSKSGPMGIVLSPDGKTIWFAEILGDKIASLDIQSNKIVEYPTGENTGPTFLTFNNEGICG
jgi:streptogramin lyase